MTNDSLKLAELWLNLKKMKDALDNDLIPVSGHLGMEDEELTEAMENLSAKIGSHFENFKLTAGAVKP
jgi:hypothetical protein